MRVAAALCSIVAGLGFGIPCVFAIRHFVRTGEVWTLLGLPTYGHGPFERWGIDTSLPLLVGFLAVCIAEVAVGAMIWTDAPGATIAALVLLPLEFAFWIGFALPFGPLLGIARSVLLFA